MDLRTKIVCTLGPASRDREVIKRMVAAGMDVARINTGHADLDELKEDIELLRGLEKEAGKRIGVMVDLQGPRLRVGSVQGSRVELKNGQDFTITTEQKRGDSSRVSVTYAGLPEHLKPGDPVLMDDGLIRMEVVRSEGPEIACRVLEGGTLSQGKGMNFPGVDIGLAAFTERDRRYLEVSLKAGADWVSQSFIRTPGDVRQVRAAVEELGGGVQIMAKIEKSEAVQSIDEILEEADGVMVARGDLGVEMNTEDVPLVQKELIAKALRAAKPVVTATQMLESMVEKPRPTRAEASDVANAILDGTDAVMLSAETAIGAYPVRAVETIARIAARAELALDYEQLLEERSRWTHASTADSIGYAACKIASDLGARALLTITRTGYTARLISRYRPSSGIISASPDPSVVGAMSVVWGVRPMVVQLPSDLREMIREVSEACRSAGMVERGDLVVVTGGFIGEKVGTTNSVNVHMVE